MARRREHDTAAIAGPRIMTGGFSHWLILQELKRLLLVPWMGYATALLCACSAFSIVLSTRDLREHKESYERQLDQRVQAQVRSINLVGGRTAEPGLRVLRPPDPGAVLVAGIEPVLPAAWELTPSGVEVLAPYARTEFGIHDRSVGDLSAVIAGLGGLLALSLGVSTLVSDRAAGRISALRTLPISSRASAFIRLAGGTLALIVVAGVWSGTVLLTLRMLLPADVSIPGVIPQSLAAPVVSYLALMFALGTAAGAAAKEELRALVVAFAIWMSIVFVVPQITQLISRSVADVPPLTGMQEERRARVADEARLLEYEVGAAMTPHFPDVPRVNGAQQQVAYDAGGESVWRAGIARIRGVAALEERQWLDKRTRADRIRRWLDCLNPRAWLSESMADIAGTGSSKERDWTQAIKAHVETLNQRLFDNRPMVNARATWKGQAMYMGLDRYRAPRFSDLPAFTAPPERSGIWTPAARRSLAGLAAYALAAMAVAYFALCSRLR
ncbi:MAG TPA: ABC transporter permease subunit [Vicinamibacterales bacterium]|nr:ABC transporter permease subunit [Vicinamibacterales bacterium]